MWLDFSRKKRATSSLFWIAEFSAACLLWFPLSIWEASENAGLDLEDVLKFGPASNGSVDGVEFVEGELVPAIWKPALLKLGLQTEFDFV